MKKNLIPHYDSFIYPDEQKFLKKNFVLETLQLELEKFFYWVLVDKVWGRILIQNPMILKENLELEAFRSCELFFEVRSWSLWEKNWDFWSYYMYKDVIR